MKLSSLKGRVPGSGIPKGTITALVFLVLYCVVRGLYHYYDQTEILYFNKKDWIPIDSDEFRSPVIVYSEEIAKPTFDPMNVDENTLIRAGLKPYLAKRWIKFRNAGGKIRSRADLLKIYGIDSNWVAKANLVFKPESASPSKREFREVKSYLNQNLVKQEPIDVNKADSISLLKLPGIGPVLSHRIINFREHLGGFINSEQFFQVYGLAGKESQLFDKIYIGPISRKIRINDDSEEQLAHHPYISKKLANLICRYRKQHQQIHNIEELKKLPILNDSILGKLIPYLTFEKLPE